MNRQDRKKRKERQRKLNNIKQAARRFSLFRRRRRGLVSIQIIDKLPVDTDGSFDIPVG